MANVSQIKTPDNNVYDIRDNSKLPLTGGTITGTLICKNRLVLDFTDKSINAGINEHCLEVRWKSKGSGTPVYTAYPIGIIGTDGTDMYNAAVRLGSTSGTTIVAAGESATAVANTVASYNDESLYLTADGSIYLYPSLPNDATASTNSWIIDGTKSRTVGELQLEWSNTLIGTSSNNMTSSNVYKGLGLYDGAASSYRWGEFYAYPDTSGAVHIYMYAKNRKTNGDEATGKLGLTVSKAGAVSYDVSNKPEFRSAIEACHYKYLGTAATSNTNFTLDTSGTYLIITAHNSTASLNTIWLVRLGGNIAFRLGVGNNVTTTVTVTASANKTLTVKTSSGTVNVYAIKLV